jgi:hypothetical protein
MHQPQSTQSIAALAIFVKVRQEQTAGIADDQLTRLPAPIDKHANLALNFARRFRQGSRKLGRNDGVHGRPARCKPFQAPQWLCAKPVCVAFYANGVVSKNSKTGISIAEETPVPKQFIPGSAR